LVGIAIILLVVEMVKLTFTGLTISIYVIFFGVLMMCVEMKFANLQPRIQRLFGFLFTFFGRAIFVVFAATMVLAIGEWPGYILGGVTFINACFNFYVFYVHPAFKTGKLSTRDNPYATYTGGEGEMANYLRRNPDLVRKAGASAVRVARDNPELARQAASGAAGEARRSGDNPWTEP
jgi:hypothetical protein